MKRIPTLVTLLILALFTGCGGGSDPGGAGTLPTTAVLTFSSQETLPVGMAVSGFSATLELPAGVTVQTGAGGATATKVVVSSGQMGGAAGMVGPVIYTPATSSTKAKLDFTIVSMTAAGVGVGEYAKTSLDLAGVTPSAGDFTVTSFIPGDMTLTPVTGLTATV